MVVEGFQAGQETAVLVSGGLDSAVLVAYELTHGPVQPIYVSVGLAWERAEEEALARLLHLPPYRDRVRPVVRLSFDMRDVYSPSHWAIRGTPPAYDTPDDEVYLAGRNVTLVSKAAVFCAERRIPRIAIGPLASNPFPDATPEFLDAMARALSLGLNFDIAVVAPFTAMHKADVIKLGTRLGVPLELSLSCMNPQDSGIHCGRCSKCRERQEGFQDAGMCDPTRYV